MTQRLRAPPAAACCDFAAERRALTLLAQALAPGTPWLLLARGEAASPLAGTPLVLPPAIDGFAEHRDNRAALRLALLWQLERHADRAAGFDLDAWLAQRPRGVGRARLRLLFLLLDGRRIAARLQRRWPGAAPAIARALAALRRHRRARPARPQPAAGALAGPALDRGAAWAALRHHLLGGRTAAAPAAGMPWQGWSARIAALQQPTATVWHSAELALEIVMRFDGPEFAAPARGVATASTGAAQAAADAAPGITGNSDGAGAAMPPPASGTRHGHRRASGAACPGASPAADDGGSAAPDDGQGPTIAPARSAGAGPAVHSHFVDEWDYRRGAYRRAWCRIEESRAQGGDRGFLQALQHRHGRTAHTLARRFALLRPPAPERARAADDGDEIDFERAVDRVAERRAGHGDDRPPYRQRPLRRPPVCAALLLDVSASTDFPLPESGALPADPAAAVPAPAPPAAAATAPLGASLYEIDESPAPVPAPPRPRVIDLARDALALMCQALHRLGDRHAVYAFDGEGRHRVRVQRVKGFAEAPSAATWGALAALVPRGATRTGAAVRHVAAELAAEEATRRLLFVVTDGYPEDSDYGGPPRDLDYALHDTARALLEAERRGITTFCIAIDHAGHDYLRRICPPRRYLVIDDAQALVQRFGEAYLALRAGG